MKPVTEEERRVSFRISLQQKDLDALDEEIERLNADPIRKTDRIILIEGLITSWLEGRKLVNKKVNKARESK